MAGDYKMITEADEMLAMLNVAPHRRTISHLELTEDESAPCVCEFPEERLTGSPNVLARVEPGGTAEALLDAAFDAHCDGDMATWSTLPVRYGPHCSMWVSADHPLAPTEPAQP